MNKSFKKVVAGRYVLDAKLVKAEWRFSFNRISEGKNFWNFEFSLPADKLRELTGSYQRTLSFIQAKTEVVFASAKPELPFLVNVASDTNEPFHFALNKDFFI